MPRYVKCQNKAILNLDKIAYISLYAFEGLDKEGKKRGMYTIRAHQELHGSPLRIAEFTDRKKAEQLLEDITDYMSDDMFVIPDFEEEV